MGQVGRVEVRSRFTGDWAAGFELADVDLAGPEARFQVRRQSDGVVLPDWFSVDEVRPASSRLPLDEATA